MDALDARDSATARAGRAVRCAQMPGWASNRVDARAPIFGGVVVVEVEVVVVMVLLDHIVLHGATPS
jgi:hypothetical protein